jgi:hypothetical protein
MHGMQIGNKNSTLILFDRVVPAKDRTGLDTEQIKGSIRVGSVGSEVGFVSMTNTEGAWRRGACSDGA